MKIFPKSGRLLPTFRASFPGFSGFLLAAMLMIAGWPQAGKAQTCSLGVSVSSVGSCDGATGLYDLNIQITYANKPASGALSISGELFPVASLPASGGSLQIKGLIADGKTVNAQAFFTAEPNCSATLSWQAPDACKSGLITILRDAQTQDNNNDGKVNLGEKIRYTLEMVNTEGTDKENITLNPGLDPNTTLVPGSFSSTPVGYPQATVNVLEDTPAPVTLQGVDLDNDALTFAISAGPAKGGISALTQLPPFDAQLIYSPNANINGPDSFTFTVTDNDGNSDATVLTLNIIAVNDAPSFTIGGDQTVGEDAGPQTVPNFATGISAGPANESAQTVSFLLLNNTNPALFAVQPAIAPDGTLTYTLAPNAAGSAMLSFAAKDNGGTANGGDDQSDSQTFAITVTAVNDAPAFTKGVDVNTLEDSDPQTVAGWATGIDDGDPGVTQTLSFSVTGNTNPSLFSAGPAISAAGALSFTPAANANGTATITIVLKDNGGTANGGTDQSAPQSFVINVAAVNDAPALTCGPDQTVGNTGGAQSVPNWVSSVSPGPADESGQTITYSVSNDHAALFAVAPSVDASGTLSYTPAPGVTGTATVTVTATDNGGTANGGDDTSDPCTFSITVQGPPVAVADAPASNSAPGSDFHTALNSALSSAATASATDNLMANDDRGFPQANVVSYGTSADPTVATPANPTPTDQGGTVAVTAAGEFIYMPPSATFTGLDQFSYRIQNSAGFSDAVVTIAVGVRPACTDDAYTGSANVPVADNADAGVLENDPGDQLVVKTVQGAEANVGVETAGANAGLGGSTNRVTLNANGTFRHSPAAGVLGAQTFTYSVSNGFGESAGCTVTVTTQDVSGKVAWFVDPSQSASSNNYGTFDDPFESIADFNAVNLGGANQPATGDVIYLDPNGTYNEADGINLSNGQELYGGLQQFSSAYAATASAEAALAAEYSSFAGTAEGTATSIATTGGNGIDLAQNNKINGVNVGNTPAGFGLAGSNVGTPVIGTVSTPMSITGTGGALNIQTGDLGSARFGTLESTASTAENLKLTGVSGTISIGAGGSGFAGSADGSAAVLVSGGTVGFTYPGAISKSNANSAVNVTGKTGGTITFSGNITASTTTANAIDLDANTGATNVFSGALALTTSFGTAFNATGGGTVAATNTNSTATSQTGVGVNITGTAIGAAGVTFKSITVSNGGGSSATSGIVLSGTGNTGFFKVVGDGSLARNGSGGTIDRATNDAVQLTDAHNVILQSMNLSNNGDNSTNLSSVTGDHTVQISGGSNIVLSGVHIQNPTGGGILALELGGTNRINNNSRIEDLTANSGFGIYAVNASTTMTLFELNNMQIIDDAAGASAVYFGTTGTGNMTLSVDNCLFEDLAVQAITAFAGAGAPITGVLTTTIRNSDFQNAKGTGENNVGLLVNGGTHNTTVEGNTFDNIAESGVVANMSVIRTQNNGGKMTAVIRNNTIQNIAFGVGAGGRHAIGHVFEPVSYNGSDFSNLDIDGNTVNNFTFDNNNREFVFIDYRANASGGNIKIRNNNFSIAPAGTTGSQQLMELRFREANASTVNVQINDNTGAGNTISSFLDIDAEALATVNATITGNQFTNSNASPGQSIDLATEAAGSSMCVNVSGNTLSPNTITLNEAAGTMKVTQASQAAVAGANSGAAVTVAGAPDFGQAACILPSN